MGVVSKRSIQICILILTCGLLTDCSFGFSANPALLATSASLGGDSLPGGGFFASPRDNLIDNSGFESGLDSWEDWGNSAILTSGTHSGSKGLRITAGPGGRGQEVIYRLKTGATYLLKAFGRVANTADDVYVGVRFFDTGNATVGDERVRVNTLNYSEYSVRFQVPPEVSSAKIYVYNENPSSSTADFDDFSLTMIADPVNPPMLAAVANPNGYQPSGPGSGWTLVFADEFNEKSLDSGIWNIGFWFDYTINNELQAYRPENVILNGGFLNLLAEERSTSTTWGEPMNFASGAVTTRGKFKFTFGVAEARLKVPKGQGYYPQFWLLPNNKRSPPEIDVAQIFGSDTTTSKSNYLWLDDNGLPHGLPSSARTADYSAGYHTFTVEWMPDFISFYIDGTLQNTYRGDFVLRDPAYLLLNLAIGGDIAGSPDVSTPFPQSMSVDYLRVWQKPL